MTRMIIWIIVLCVFVFLGVSCEKADKSQAEKTPEVMTTESGVDMIVLPGGWFGMGSDKGEDDESPVHRIWVDGFLMDRYEVTQEQYEKLIRGNPSHFKGDDNPVEQISWAHAALYCNARSRTEGLEPCYDEETAECNFQANGYRLPTEAEWEYACRAGSKTEHFFGREFRRLREYTWFADNSLEKTHPVGQRKPNAWGLYDMYGNVAEWCNDIYSEGYYSNSPERNPRGTTEGEKYVLRGGSWNSSSDSCRSAYRVGEDPGFQDACFSRDDIGFRCVKNGQQKVVEQAKLELAPDFGELEVDFNLGGVRKPRLSVNRGAAMFGALLQNPGSSMQHRASKTGFVYDDIYLKHDTGDGHPERVERLGAIRARISGGHMDPPLQDIVPLSDVLEWISMIHSPGYVKRVREYCQDGCGYLDSPDTPVSEKSYDAAVAAVGGVLAAIDEVMAGKVRNAFCAVRPPGHHALKDRAMGFCIFNNVAIGARYIQKKYGLSKVLIIDWDVHHGNGTQDAFYDDPSVFYFSTHQYPFYPGTGSADETGEGEGISYTVNVPMKAGSGDKEHKKAFEEQLRPKAMEFDPDFVLISAGFDAHEDDLLGGLKVTTEGFAEMTKIVKDIAEKSCDGRLVSVLEGGYDLDGLAESVAAHISVLQE